MHKVIVLLTSLLVLNSCGNNPPDQPATESPNVDLVNQYFQHFNSHNWQKMAEMYTETAAFKDPSLGLGIVKQTRKQTIQKYAELSKTFPDIKDSVLQVYPSGQNHVAVEFVSRGTAPDGSKFELPICTIFTIENGKIVKDFTYYDNFEE